MNTASSTRCSFLVAVPREFWTYQLLGGGLAFHVAICFPFNRPHKLWQGAESLLCLVDVIIYREVVVFTFYFGGRFLYSLIAIWAIWVGVPAYPPERMSVVFCAYWQIGCLGWCCDLNPCLLIPAGNASNQTTNRNNQAEGSFSKQGGRGSEVGTQHETRLKPAVLRSCGPLIINFRPYTLAVSFLGACPAFRHRRDWLLRPLRFVPALRNH